MPITRHEAAPTAAAVGPTAGGLAQASLELLRVMAVIADASLAATAPQLSLQQFRALSVLHERGPLPATRLADALGIAPSTLTRLADRLLQAGLVDRHADEHDRRVVLLAPTRKGARTAERVRAWRLAELSRRFEAVSAVDRRSLHAAVRQLGEVLRRPTVTSPDHHERRS